MATKKVSSSASPKGAPARAKRPTAKTTRAAATTPKSKSTASKAASSKLGLKTDLSSLRAASVGESRAKLPGANQPVPQKPARGMGAGSKGDSRPIKIREDDVPDLKPGEKATNRKGRQATEQEALESGSGVRIDVGDSAPSFVLKDDSQTIVSSESFRGAPYVLYFYPKDDTPGCTLQACGFRDLMSRFAAKGVKVVGVSADTPESHQRFKKKYSLNFPLISDPEKTLAKAYGVWVKKKNYGREYMGIERSTFVIDRTGHIKHVFRGVRVPGHVEAVLDLV